MSAMPAPTIHPNLALDVVPSSVVVVRDGEWLVTQVAHTQDGTLVTVQGLSELVRDTTAQFYSDLDEITVFDPRETRVVADASPNYRTARLWLEATLRKSVVPVGDPTLSVVGDMLADPLDYQHAAVRRALDPDTLVLDDRADALTQPSFATVWRDWLRMANVLGFAEIPVSISTTELVAVGGGSPSAALPSDLVWAAFPMVIATDLEQALAAELTRIGVPEPDSTFDEIEGVPVSCAWTTGSPIAVLADPSPEDVAALGDRTVVAMSDDVASVAETVRAALVKGKA